MPAYLIVDTQIENAEEYEKYKALAKPIAEQYGGVYRVRGGDMDVVAPGVIATPMFSMEEKARDAFLATATQNFVIPRAGEAAEVAQAILFLIQNEFVTGTTIDVDGGALLP